LDWRTLVPLLAIGILVNLPLGMWRAHLRRFSPSWFVAVHLSIPLVLFLRLYWGLPPYVVPADIAACVAGQIVGGKLGRRQLAD
jgi:hypothetical protein